MFIKGVLGRLLPVYKGSVEVTYLFTKGVLRETLPVYKGNVGNDCLQRVCW